MSGHDEVSCGVRLCRPVLIVLALVAVAAGGCNHPPQRSSPATEDITDPQQLKQFARAEQRIHSVDARERRQAAIVLLSMDKERARRAVLQNLSGSHDPAVRISMIDAIVFCQDHKSFEAVLEHLNDPDDAVRDAAVCALAHFTRPEEVKAMEKLLRKDSTTPRQSQLLFRALGEGLAFRAVPVLVAGLRSDSEQVKAAAGEALRRISRRDLPPDAKRWNEWWEANKHKSREDILEEHIRARSRHLDAKNAALADLQREYEQLLALVKSPASGRAKLLLDALESPYQRIKEYAALTLSALPKDHLVSLSLDSTDTYEKLRKAFEDTSVEVRRDCVRAAVQLKGRYREDLIAKALNDKEPQVLLPAVNAVEKGLSTAVLNRLMELLDDEKHPAVRESAANALGKLGSAQAVGALIARLDDQEENVRWFAVESLRKLSAKNAVPKLTDLLLKDESSRVREVTAIALGDLGQPGAVPALRKALKDENERVRAKVVSALQGLATGDFERMTLIGNELIAYRHLDTAKDVLRRIVQQFGDKEECRAEIIETRKKLGAVLTEQQDYAAAAEVYERLDEMVGGQKEVRQMLIESWLAAGKADQLISAIPRWLKDADKEKAGQVIDVCLPAAERFIRDGQKAVAAKVLELLLETASAHKDQERTEKIEKLRKQTAG